MTTVADLLAARQDDDHPAVVAEEGTWTWAEVVHGARVRADLLATLRRPGPFHVGVLLENVPEWILWIGAAAFAGATVVGVNPTRRGAELAADVRHTDCQLLVTDSVQAGLLAGLDLGPATDRRLLVDSPAYAAQLADHADPGPGGRGEEADRLLLLFTSGSTGAPKAVICSQGRLATIAGTASGLFGMTRDDVCYQSMPFFHGNAIMANWAPALAVGATVALRRRFSASGFLPDVRRFGATYFNYVGRSLAYVLATPPTADDRDHRLRLGFGTEASARDRERFTERFGCPVVESYGSSEGVIAIQRRPDAPPTALGLPPEAPIYDVAIADPVSGAECPRAEFDRSGRLLNGHVAIGEIVNRAGAPAFEGYYRNDEALADRLRDGWYWSGDLGYRDADGWFYFAGRSADWLRVDSENFAAAPVERILHRLPGVVMAAVFPVPDTRTGDQVMAVLELEDGTGFDPDAFARFLDAQADLGTKWAPRYVAVVGSMPLTGTNKVDKRPLRAAAWRTADPVWWRPGRDDPYRRLTAADVAALETELAANDRSSLLGGDAAPPPLP